MVSLSPTGIITFAINFLHMSQLLILATSSKLSDLPGTATHARLWPKAEIRCISLYVTGKSFAINQPSQIICHACPSYLLFPVSEEGHWHPELDTAMPISFAVVRLAVDVLLSVLIYVRWMETDVILTGLHSACLFQFSPSILPALQFGECLFRPSILPQSTIHISATSNLVTE